MLLAVSPAFAGFGSAVDSGSHAVAGASLMTSAATGDFVITNDSSEDGQSDSQPGKVMHCAFSHCAHCYVDASTGGDDSDLLPTAELFQPRLYERLAAASTNGLERRSEEGRDGEECVGECRFGWGQI